MPKKKDKRYHSYLDNYTSRYSDNFIVMLFYVAAAVVSYLLYQGYKYFF